MKEQTKKEINALIEYIDKTSPVNLDMHVFLRNYDENGKVVQFGAENICRTVGCIAGEYVMMKYAEKKLTLTEVNRMMEYLDVHYNDSYDLEHDDFYEYFDKNVGINDEDKTESLLILSNWPDPFFGDYMYNRKARKEVIISRLKHFLETGE